MAYGAPPKQTRTYPPGARAFGHSSDVTARSDLHIDGAHPAGYLGSVSTKGASRGYADGESYRSDRRGDTSRGLTDRRESEGPNRAVLPRGIRRYGVNGSRLPNASYRSTGSQNPSQQNDQLPPSWPARSHTSHVPAGGISRRVGYPGGGRPFVPAEHFTTRLHGSDGIDDPRHRTDHAPGQAHSASGGHYGKPQSRPAPDNGPRVRATFHNPRGKLLREDYTAPRPRKSRP